MSEKKPAEKELESPEDKMLERLPDGLRPLKGVENQAAQDLLDIAEQLVASARKRFGNHSSKPRLKYVEKLFTDHAGKAPPVEKELDHAIRRLDTVEKAATLDQAYDKTMATAFNAFDKISVDAGAAVQEAYDAWTMAVRIYESDSRSAGAIFQAEIEKAKRPAGEFSSDGSRRETAQVHHYTKSAAIATALVAYEKSMQKSANALAVAFGALIQGLYSSYAKTAVGEATLISTSNTASLAFWNGVQKELARVLS